MQLGSQPVAVVQCTFTHTHTHTHNTQNDTKQAIHTTTQKFFEECVPYPVFAGFTLAVALQLRKKHGKTSVRVVEECQLAR